jgi:hypothetical protein
MVAEGRSVPLAFVARVDISESLRLHDEDFDRAPLAASSRLVDDLALWWRPHVAADVVVGRVPVPLSRFRQSERAHLTTSSLPFPVDRVVPERRWGATLLGDLGELAYAAGAYADVSELELRTSVDDPSLGGLAAFALHLEWTPLAPIGAGQLGLPRREPWYPEPLVSVGAGLLYRLRGDDLPDRIDATFGGQVKYRRFSAVAELIGSAVDGDVELSAAGEVGLMLGDRWALLSRGDLDGGLDRWSAGGGASYFVTADRLSKVVLLGWVRRDTEPGGSRRDGVVALLHTAI